MAAFSLCGELSVGMDRFYWSEGERERWSGGEDIVVCGWYRHWGLFGDVGLRGIGSMD